MGKFIGEVGLFQHRNNCKRFWIKGQLVYEANDGTNYVIKGGWHTDGRSDPLNCPIATCRLYKSLLHDLLYGAQVTTRKQADQLFLEESENIKTSKILRCKEYIGVRLGGWNAWNRATPKSREYYRQFIEVIPNEKLATD